MKNRMSGVAVMSVLFASQLVFSPMAHAQAAAASYGKLTLEVSGGSNFLPVKKVLSATEKSIVESPDHMTGTIRNVRADLNLSRNWSLGLTGGKIESHGYGVWARDDTAQTLLDNQVEGTASGRTDWDLQYVTLDVERRFWVKRWLAPYVRLGGGLGQLTVVFNGKFHGYETQSGSNYPVDNDATDRVVMHVPVVALEFGARLYPTERLVVSPSLYTVNGGYGAKLGLGCQFGK